jgi:hypothetical protein
VNPRLVSHQSKLLKRHESELDTIPYCLRSRRAQYRPVSTRGWPPHLRSSQLNFAVNTGEPLSKHTMASAHPTSSLQPAPVPQPAAPPTATLQAASPPSRQNLRNWWKYFGSKGLGKNHDTQGISPQFPYNLQFKEGSMNRDVLVAEDVPCWLLKEPPNASQSGSSHQRTPPRAR